MISANIEIIRRRIAAAAAACGRRAEEIKLVAVSKFHPASAVKEAYDAGLRVFGESYAQEMEEKAEELAALRDIEWHFVGHLQRNKVKYIIKRIKCIHSLDSIPLAEEINKRSDARVNCFVEVNLAGEASKTGIDGKGARELIRHAGALDKITIVGLMTMPPLDADPERSRPYFAALRKLMDEINNEGIYPAKLAGLSMGMTGDLEIAIEEGATVVRVGTAIFGERSL